jgi:hypothetical protein
MKHLHEQIHDDKSSKKNEMTINHGTNNNNKSKKSSEQ